MYAQICRVNDKLEDIFQGVGLKVGRQNYTYSSSGNIHSGQNIYAILQAPRGDATEAIVLVAAWRNIKGEMNRNGVALLLTLARYFKRRSSQLCLNNSSLRTYLLELIRRFRMVSLVERYHSSCPSR
jgi:hypothetical protein